MKLFTLTSFFTNNPCDAVMDIFVDGCFQTSVSLVKWCHSCVLICEMISSSWFGDSQKSTVSFFCTYDAIFFGHDLCYHLHWACSHGNPGHDPEKSILCVACAKLFTQVIRNHAISYPFNVYMTVRDMSEALTITSVFRNWNVVTQFMLAGSIYIRSAHVQKRWQRQTHSQKDDREFEDGFWILFSFSVRYIFVDPISSKF